MIYRLILAALCVVCFAMPAEARQRSVVAHSDCNGTGPNAMTCIGVAPSARGERIARKVGFGTAQQVYRQRVAKADWRSGIRQKQDRRAKPRQIETASYGAPTPSVAYTVNKAVAQVVGGRPAGCPHAFCGCGASLHLFGKIIPALNLAANWLRFPRAEPAPGMVAARRGHVFVLKQHLGGNVWLAFDANSGGQKTRIHARSIAGYTVVNPHGGSA